MTLTPQKSRHLLTLAGLFFFALAIRLAILFQLHGSDVLAVILGDSKAYHEWAIRISQGDWIGTEVFYQSPLYSYFLALIYKVFGPSLTAVRIIQSILGSLACVALFDAARRFFNPKTGLFAGIILALFPVAIFFDLIIQKSALDSFLIALLLLALSRLCRPSPSHPRTVLWSAALGLTAGLFALNRENALPIALLLPGLVILSLALSKKSTAPPLQTLTRSLLNHALPYALAFALVLLPVLLRNKHVGGEFHLTTSQFGPNFYIGNNPSADGTYAPLIFGRGDAQYERIDAVALAEQAANRKLTPGEVSNHWRDKALSFITQNPAAFTKLTLRKTALAFNATELGDTEDLYTWAEYSSLLNILSLLHVGLLVPLAGVGLLLTWPHRKRLLPLYVITFLYFASVIAFYIFARYRYPGILMLIPFAAAAVAAPWRIIFTTPSLRPARIAAIAVLIPLTIFSNLTLIPAIQMQAVSHANLGSYFAIHGQPDKALPHLAAAVDLNPALPDGYFNLALFYVNARRPDLALTVLDAGLNQIPNHPELLRLRAHAASQLRARP